MARVLFKGNDPRAGHEINVDRVAAQRFVDQGLADAVQEDEAQPGEGGEGGEATTRRRRPTAAKKAARKRS